MKLYFVRLKSSQSKMNKIKTQETWVFSFEIETQLLGN
uniref:Uncharacterized protein n=1 Tax=Rhizophora mucronata TaxID=61149 RepID=A0A2P2NRG0_RHIMU